MVWVRAGLGDFWCFFWVVLRNPIFVERSPSRSFFSGVLDGTIRVQAGLWGL